LKQFLSTIEKSSPKSFGNYHIVPFDNNQNQKEEKGVITCPTRSTPLIMSMPQPQPPTSSVNSSNDITNSPTTKIIDMDMNIGYMHIFKNGDTYVMNECNTFKVCGYDCNYITNRRVQKRTGISKINIGIKSLFTTVRNPVSMLSVKLF